MAELYTVSNIGTLPFNLLIPKISQSYATDAARGVQGSYTVTAETYGDGSFNLNPGESVDFSLVIKAYPGKDDSVGILSATEELEKRKTFIDSLDENLILNTPDDVIDAEFRYAKIRGSESIYKTKGGYMHGPGGESYYAALWCNDQAE